MKKIIKFIVIISLIIGVFFIIKNKDNFDDNLNIRLLQIKSGSMYPVLNVNDFILIKKSDDYNIGDIITFNVDNKYLVTHRIIEEQENKYVTKGDNNNSEDENTVKCENVKGKVIVIIKEKYLRIIVIILLIFILIYLIKKGFYNEKNN